MKEGEAVDLRLKLIDEAGTSRLVPLVPGAKTTGGRLPDSAAYLPCRFVSRKHFVVTVDAAGVWVTDCDSMNGTWLDEVRLPPGQATLWSPCEALRVGTFQLRLVPARTIDPVWLRWNDRTVLRLTAAIYEGHRFGDLPLLHDALLDAGCDNEDILDHCRHPGPHVRGCWVLDLLLGKE
jgi:hypothetical protein